MRKLPRVEHWDCNCIPCRMVRAGVCLDCAITVHEQALEHLGRPGLCEAQLCSESCYDAFEDYLADPTVWRVGELKPDPLFGCGADKPNRRIASEATPRKIGFVIERVSASIDRKAAGVDSDG